MRVEGVGFRVRGLVFRVQGSGFKVWGLKATISQPIWKEALENQIPLEYSRTVKSGACQRGQKLVNRFANTPTRKIRQRVRAPARNHPERWKLHGNVSSTTTKYLTYRIGTGEGLPRLRVEILYCNPKGRRAVMRIPSMEGRSVCLSWAKSKPKGPKGWKR